VDEDALEAHHNTPIMEEIIKLHRKYNLTLKVEKFNL
jgi:quinol monooxygenase YgiN